MTDGTLRDVTHDSGKTTSKADYGTAATNMQTIPSASLSQVCLSDDLFTSDQKQLWPAPEPPSRPVLTDVGYATDTNANMRAHSRLPAKKKSDKVLSTQLEYSEEVGQKNTLKEDSHFEQHLFIQRENQGVDGRQIFNHSHPFPNATLDAPAYGPTLDDLQLRKYNSEGGATLESSLAFSKPTVHSTPPIIHESEISFEDCHTIDHVLTSDIVSGINGSAFEDANREKVVNNFEPPRMQTQQLHNEHPDHFLTSPAELSTPKVFLPKYKEMQLRKIVRVTKKENRTVLSSSEVLFEVPVQVISSHSPIGGLKRGFVEDDIFTSASAGKLPRREP